MSYSQKSENWHLKETTLFYKGNRPFVEELAVSTYWRVEAVVQMKSLFSPAHISEYYMFLSYLLWVPYNLIRLITTEYCKVLRCCIVLSLWAHSPGKVKVITCRVPTNANDMHVQILEFSYCIFARAKPLTLPLPTCSQFLKYFGQFYINKKNATSFC